MTVLLLTCAALAGILPVILSRRADRMPVRRDPPPLRRSHDGR